MPINLFQCTLDRNRNHNKLKTHWKNFRYIMRISHFSLSFLSLLCYHPHPSLSKSAGKVITTSQGFVQGKISISRSGRLFMDYWGIPYGVAKRFELADPVQKWEGVFRAYKKPSPCLYQNMMSREVHGSEDCLYINVHTPVVSSLKGNPLPVIVIIHGGFSDWQDQAGFFMGARYFMEEEVIMVSFNYRLGPFGFMTTQDDTIPSNLGLRDQILAFKWVRKNIHSFGGDKNKITLLGHGFGGASIHHHLLSPMTKGLFHQAIIQSGSAICPWSIVDNPDRTIADFAKLVNCSDNMESEAVIQCLREKDAKDLVEKSSWANYLFAGNRETTGNNVYFGPVVEHWMRGCTKKNIFLPDYPENLIKNLGGGENTTGNGTTGNATGGNSTDPVKIPLLIGINELDGVTLDWADHIFRQLQEPKNGTANGTVAGASTESSSAHQPTTDKPSPSEEPGTGGTTEETKSSTEMPPTSKKSKKSTSSHSNNLWEELTEDRFPLFFGYKNRAGNNTDEINKKITEHYFKDKGVHNGDHGETFFKALGHRNYFQCVRSTAASHSKVADTFLYYLSYNRNVSHLDFWINQYHQQYKMIATNKTLLRGAVHGDELQYLFDLDEWAQIPLIRKYFRELSLSFSQNMVKLWVSFASKGKPAPDWEPVTGDKASLKFVKLDDKREQIDLPCKADVDFWDSLAPLMGEETRHLAEQKTCDKHHVEVPAAVEEEAEEEEEEEEDANQGIIYVDLDGDDDGTGGLFNFS